MPTEPNAPVNQAAHYKPIEGYFYSLRCIPSVLVSYLRTLFHALKTLNLRLLKTRKPYR